MRQMVHACNVPLVHISLMPEVLTASSALFDVPRHHLEQLENLSVSTYVSMHEHDLPNATYKGETIKKSYEYNLHTVDSR